MKLKLFSLSFVMFSSLFSSNLQLISSKRVPFTKVAVSLPKSFVIPTHEKALAHDKTKISSTYNNLVTAHSAIQSNPDIFKIEKPLALKGGGVLGAQWGFWFGKAAVYGASAVVITAVGAVVQVAVPVPGSGTYVATHLGLALAGPIEATSNAIGIATGIYGAVATGPV